MQQQQQALDDFTQLNNAWLSHEGGPEGGGEEGKMMALLRRSGDYLALGAGGASMLVQQTDQHPTFSSLPSSSSSSSSSSMGQAQQQHPNLLGTSNSVSVSLSGMLDATNPHNGEDDFLNRFMWESEETACTAVV